MGAKLTINNIFLVIDYIQQHTIDWLRCDWRACRGRETRESLGGIATSLKAGPHWFHFMPRVCLEWVIHPSVHDMPQIERYHIINFFWRKRWYDVQRQTKTEMFEDQSNMWQGPFRSHIWAQRTPYVYYTYIEEGYLKYHPRFVQIFSPGLLKIGSYKLCYEW